MVAPRTIPPVGDASEVFLPSRKLTLAWRLGLTTHESPLMFRLIRLRTKYPEIPRDSVETWLLEVANSRGADIVSIHPGEPPGFALPESGELANEEVVAGLCLPQCVDRPHLLRPAAQLISRGALDMDRLVRLAVRERLGPILGTMARTALRVDAAHVCWKRLAAEFSQSPPRDEPIIHWTRLAHPIFEPGRPNATNWRLAA